MKGWIVNVADEYRVPVSVPTAGRAKYLAWRQFDIESFGECVPGYKARRAAVLDGYPEGVLETLGAMRLAGIPWDEYESTFWCWCGSGKPVCSGCCNCREHGCECAEIYGVSL